MQITGTGQPAHAWLVVGFDATIVAADDSACPVLGVRTPGELHGHAWTAFVLPADVPAAAEAVAAVRAGTAWRGALHFLGTSPDTAIDVEVTPTTGTSAVALVHLHAPTADRAAAPSDALLPPRGLIDEQAVVAAQLAALEALAALPEPSAAARSVLQALAGAVRFDWGAVLRFVREPGASPAGVEVVAVYPSAMAGVDRGLLWSPPDPAQAGVIASGDPELAGPLPDEPGARSPLRRMRAFGMTSRIHVPLYAGAEVAGCLVIYASGAALSARDGIVVERVSRALGTHVVPNAAPSAPHRPSAEPGTPAAGHALAHEAPSSLPAAPPAPESPPAPVPPAEGRLNALSEVISGVAHELNNPLTAILGYAQIFHSLDGDEREHAVNTIEREAQRAARIVRNLLSFARQETPRTTRLDLEEILQRVIEVMRYSLEVDNVRTELRFAGVPEVEADRGQMEQVFLNLVSNAQQALQPGGGTIVVTTAASGNTVRVAVADDGPGVPDEMRDRIFEPFFTTRAFGQGMGLSTVYGVVTQHGGRVWVEPTPGGGATFVVELPAARSTPTPTTPASTAVPGSSATFASSAAPSAAPGGMPGGMIVRRPTESVLVVDDELPIRALTTEILSHAGYRVTTAATGDEALRRLEAMPYDLVVADMRMPGMDGGTLYERICERWPQMERRVIFITGDVEGERTNRRLSRGDLHFLEKPFDTGALLAAIRHSLDGRGDAEA